MKKRSVPVVLILAFFMVLACAGCAAAGVDSLYALPKLSDEYIQLENLIEQRISDGSEYAAPTSGHNRQSVQLHDLDGDGTAEAIAFLADNSHVPTVCVYRMGDNGDYRLYAILSGEGSAVSSVEYADLNGNGVSECVIVWQLSGDLRILSAYSLRAEEPSRLMSANCSDFLVCDLDGNGAQDILLLRGDENGTSTLVRYVFDGESEPASYEASLSAGVTDVLRMKTGYLSDGTTALFVESEWEDEELITDVFTSSGGELSNITIASGGRSNTLRMPGAFAADINGDRIMEIPESAGDILNWYSVDPSGRRNLAMTTYHDYEHGWYLALDDILLNGTLSVSASDPAPGETMTTFAVDAGGGRTPILIVYTLTGENRLDRAREDGRFILKPDASTVYAAEVLTDAVTQETVTDSFNIIYPEWQTWE